MLLEAGGIPLVLVSFSRDGVVLQHAESGETRLTTEHELHIAIRNGQVTISGKERLKYAPTDAQINRAELVASTDRALDVWIEKIRWLNGLRHLGIDTLVNKPYVATAINTLAQSALIDIRKYSISTLYEADLKIRKAGGDLLAAIPDYISRGGRGGSRLAEKAFDIMVGEVKRAAEDPYDMIDKTDIHQNISTLIKEHNLENPDAPIDCPSPSTVSRYIRAQIPAEEIDRKRYGSKKSNKRYRNNSHARDSATSPLEVGEFDDVDCAVFLVDERTGLPWGRAYLTSGVSQGSGMLLGYDLSDIPRSFYSALGAICNTLLPKADCLPGEMGYGVLGTYLMDNASYNTGLAMQYQAKGLGILLSAARPFGPTEKTTIEHFNNIIKSDFCSTLPGWVGKKGDRESLEQGMNRATMTLQGFQRALHIWCTKVYSNSPGEDGFTPKERWFKYYEKFPPAIRYSKEQLSIFRLRPETLTFRASGGLERLNLRYSSDLLDDLRRHHGFKSSVQAFVDYADLTYIVVLNEKNNAFFRVNCSEDPEYLKGLTERQQQLILSMCRQRGLKNPCMTQLYEGRQELRKLVMQASESNKLRKRTWARRHNLQTDQASTSHQEFPQAPEEKTEKVMTELEYQIEDLKSISLGDIDQW